MLKRAGRLRGSFWPASVATIVLTEWEIGQRLTDIVLFRREAEYLPAEGVFGFDQRQDRRAGRDPRQRPSAGNPRGH